MEYVVVSIVFDNEGTSHGTTMVISVGIFSQFHATCLGTGMCRKTGLKTAKAVSK